MTIFIPDDYYGDLYAYSDTAFVQDKPTHSRLLDSDGKPLRYKQRAIGFDLTPKNKNEKE